VLLVLVIIFIIWYYILQETLWFHCEYFFEIEIVDCFPITSLILEAVYPIELLEALYPPLDILDIANAVVFVIIFIVKKTKN